MQRVVRWLSLLLIFMVPWEDSVTIGASSSLARLLGIAVAGLWLMSVLARGRVRRFHAFHALLLLFVLWNVATAFWTFDLELTQQRIKTYVQLGLFALILWDQFTTEESLRAGLQAYVAGSWVCIVSAIANYRAGIEAAAFSGGRYTATGVNAVDLAVTLALGLPLAWHLATSERGPDTQGPAVQGPAVQGGSLVRNIVRVLNFAFIPAALFAMVLSGSRTFLFALVPTVLYVLWSFPRLKLRLRVVLFVGVVALAFLAQSALPESAVARLGTVGASIGTGDLGGRADLWDAALSQFVEYPLAGIGSGSFDSPGVAGTFVHNTFLSVLTETGLIGFVIFVAALGAAVVQALRQPKPSARLWLCVILVWVMGAMSLTWEFRKATWVMLTFAVASAAAASQRRAEAELQVGQVEGPRLQEDSGLRALSGKVSLPGKGESGGSSLQPVTRERV